MLKFFRRIRQQLLSQNRFRKYILYAIGEIVLVMVGIILALQVNNWNEGRKQREQFRVTLEQMYSSVVSEIDFLRQDSLQISIQLTEIQTLLDKPDSIDNYKLPIILYHLTADYTDYRVSETAFHVQNLDYNENIPEQQSIIEQTVKYVEKANNDVAVSYNNTKIRQSLESINLPFPRLDNMDMQTIYYKARDYYDTLDIKNARKLIESREFRTILKSSYTPLAWESTALNRHISLGQALLPMYKNYHPELKLLYDDIGIIGSSLNGWEKSTPMIKTDFDNNIWEIDLYLKEGEVKFRCRDSWTQNWGGTTFPEGGTKYNSQENINVTKAGNYHIILNLTEENYQFILQRNKVE